MIVSRLLDGYDAASDEAKQLEVLGAESPAAVDAAPTEATTSRPRLPRVSPVSYTSHAMMLQLQEYRARVHSAFQTTYQHPLAAAASTPRKRNAHRGSYCRARILASSRQLFAAEARSGAPAAPMLPCSPPRASIKGGGVAFHRTTTSPRSTAHESLFALGPGQYDITPRRPATTGSVKFSPADRFREHAGGGSSDPHAPGPGQYLPDDRVITKRSARVVFSQLPRRTETAEPPRSSVYAPPATADVVSSYYYIPRSGFVAPGDAVAKTGGGIPNWSRTARFPGRRREHFHQTSAHTSPAIDYIARNKARIESMSAGQRQRRRMQQAKAQLHQPRKHQEAEERGSSSVRRRDSLFSSNLHKSTEALPTKRCSAVSGAGNPHDVEAREAVQQAWGTLVVLSFAQTKFVRLLVVATVLDRLRQAREARYKGITFQSWKRVRDRDAMRALAAALIARSSFRFRLSLRVERKIRAAALLRVFLSGLSVDVRFAMAVRRMQRRIVLLQRWWRRARLVVRAREQCLAYKWLVIEQRVRAEHVGQMPHLQRIFQPPPVAAASGSSNSLMKRRASVTGAAEAQMPLHKLLNLPEQTRWFTARFVLSPDGALRAYTADGLEDEDSEAKSDALAGNPPVERLMLEVKHFRCHAHGFANLSMGSMHGGGEDEGEGDHRPYLMLFRPGASRFVLMTDTANHILAPLLDWKDKLERHAGNPVGSPYPGGGSHRDFTDMLAQTDPSVLDEANEEAVVRTSTSSRRMSLTAGSANSERVPLTLQERRRSSRQRLRRSNVYQPVAEGELSYYVVDLLRDCPRIPAPVMWTALREKLREERKNFRSEIYRFKLEIARYQQHERERRQLVVLDKFKEFFVRLGILRFGVQLTNRNLFVS
jgi:hypothetical protein